HNTCVLALSEAIRLWRHCLVHALPLEERYLQFKISDALQDLAYYLRKLERMEEAEQAIQDCLELKEGSKVGFPGDLAVAIGEYAKILSVQGRYMEALQKSDHALSLIEEIAQQGDPIGISDKGMLLIERAQIYELQYRLDEAVALAEQGVTLLNNNRRVYKL